MSLLPLNDIKYKALLRKYENACARIKELESIAAPTPPLNTQDGVDERAEFEKWFERIHNDTWTFYKENLFQAWQARSNLSKNTEKKG